VKKIEAKIYGIEYKPLLKEKRVVIDMEKLDVNTNLPSKGCIVKDNDFSFYLSKWITPKRTRSYPYEKIYNSLFFSKRITIIPVVKDEGKDGDRDFIQWDTISLMSLLDVFIIFAVYTSAERHSNKTKEKITNQKIDNDFIMNKIKEIKQYHSSALHWNLKEAKNLDRLFFCAKENYLQISKKLNVSMHNFEKFDKKIEELKGSLNNFINTSRKNAKEAQIREVETIQPKEFLVNAKKASITIKNYLGGKYYLTVDEIEMVGNKIFLIESKHSKSSFPSIADIKDGLLKMVIFSNLENLKVDGKDMEYKAVLKLTYKKMTNKKELLSVLYEEARINKFDLVLKEI